MTPTTFFTSLMIAWVVVYIAIPAWMLMRGWIVCGGLVQLIGAFLPGIWHGVFWPDEAGKFGLLMMMLVPIPLCIIVIGIWAQNFEQLQIIPMMIVTPLTFLGGAFYSVGALAEPWRTVTLFNPVVYLISGFRWTFFGVADVPVWSSVAMMVAIIALCLAAIAWVFKTGYRLKQ